MAGPNTRSVTKTKNQNKLKKKVVLAMRTLRSRLPKTNFNQIPNEVIDNIFGRINKKEQIRMRLVCGRWKGVADGLIASPVQYIRLNVKKFRSSKWRPAPSIRAMQFQGVWDEPANLRPNQKASLTIQGAKFSQQTAESIGLIFPNLVTLVIYFDLEDTSENINNLIHIWSQKLPKVESFSLIMSKDITRDNTLSTICTSIGQAFGQLKRLDLFVSDFELTRPFGLHPSVELSHSIRSLTHFGISCRTENIYSTLSNIGKGNRALRKVSDKNRQLESVSFQFQMTVLEIEQMFVANHNLCHVIRVQLSRVDTSSPQFGLKLENFLDKFVNLQNLQLYHNFPQYGLFNKYWIKTLATLPKLTELTLVEFVLQMGIPMKPAFRLPNIKKFTLATYDLMFPRHPQFNVLNIYESIDSFAHMFPSLEELVIRAGEKQNHVWPLSVSREKIMKLALDKMRPNIKSVSVNLQDATFLNLRKKAEALFPKDD